MTSTPPLGLGVVGAGRFATFLSEAVADLPDVVVRAVSRPRPRGRRRAGQGVRRPGARLGRGPARPTPASTSSWWRPHPRRTPRSRPRRCARDGTCSARSRWPPAARTSTGCVAAAAAGPACSSSTTCSASTRCWPASRRLQDEILGPPQRFLFENDASDEDLGDGHWFWDARLSGGIFVEHGVHFFDAAAMLLGRPATAVQATAATRAGTGLTDLVSATVRHGDDVLATHTHSFTHAHRCERQLMRLDHGAAETRIEGWIPIDAVVDLWTDDAGAALVRGAARPGRRPARRAPASGSAPRRAASRSTYAGTPGRPPHAGAGTTCTSRTTSGSTSRSADPRPRRRCTPRACTPRWPTSSRRHAPAPPLAPASTPVPPPPPRPGRHPRGRAPAAPSTSRETRHETHPPRARRHRSGLGRARRRHRSSLRRPSRPRRPPRCSSPRPPRAG